jgi:signal transduction histidine kinase/ligand-binding sensor domain-containing protein
LKSRAVSIIIILLLLLTSLSNGYSQHIPLKFTKLSIDDGLSSSIVSCIIQDHEGFVWIGTPDGLNRYDGFKFVVYKNDPADSTTLADNVIQTIFEDHDKNLLIGSENGLSVYNREKDCFFNCMYEKSSPLRGISCSIKKIREDSKGNLWLASNVGLIYFDREKNSIIRYSHDHTVPESLSNDNVESVLSDKSGRLWVTTRKGLNQFLPGTATFKHYTSEEDPGHDLSNTVFVDIVEDNEGNLWFSSTEGLYCLKQSDLNSTKLIHYQYDSNDKSSLSINQVTSLFVDDAGNLWIGTENGGMNLYDKKTNGFWHYRIDDYDPQSLNNESIESIYQDRTGNLWVGTYTGGLNIAMKNSDAISKYQNLPGAPFSLSHNTVTSFFEDHNNKIWVGTDGGGLNLFSEQDNRFRRYKTDNSGIGSNSILAILEDSSNRIWLGTWAGGLVCFDSKTGSFTSFTTRNSSIPDDNIFAISEGYDNDLWLGTFEHGLVHYQIKENKFTDLTPDNSGIGNIMIVKLVPISEHRLLVGTTMNFQIYSPGKGQFTTYTTDQKNENSLSYPRVNDILFENDTCIWIGTPDGLNRFNPKNGSFKRYYEKDGLPNNFIKALILDNSGALWVTTNKGICRFDYRYSHFKNFTKADGLQSNEFTERSILKTKTGALLLGGTKGFNIIQPEKISENKTIPEVLITDFKIFNKSVKPGVKNSSLKQNITDTKSLTLSYEQSVLSFSVAIMDFTAPEKNKFAYMLENFDKEWVYPDKTGEVTYTNLGPGKYVFRVKGSNNDGLWNETGTSLRITILPPWWETWWFRLIILSAVILLFTFILLWRVRQLKNQKILLERSVAIKTAELKELNASKDKFFSIIAHDLKNPFSTIIGFSEMLNEEYHSENQEKTKEYAKIINTSAVQTLRLLENLLEWANSQRGKVSFNPDLINLNELLDEELCTLTDMANEKNIALKSTVASNLTVFADRNMIRTILRNLISNAIKFTHRNGQVEVKASASNNEVEVDVSDSGIGMTQEIISKLFRIDANLSTLGTENEKGTGLGLFLCKEFVEKHGGRIWVESEPSKGSVFKIILPVGSKA